MSSNTSGAPCYTCAHGSMCSIREQYLKFFEHRDQIMCKVGPDGSTDNTVDTSNDVRIYVEHRYMNGPGLDDLYARLGLAAPTYCCLVPQNRCPLHRPGIGSYDRDYFDSPIMNKWNAPLGYISSICEPEKWEAHKYALPYKKPFIPMNDPCRTCFNVVGEKPRSANLIAGTPYSTFAVTNLTVKTGDVLRTDDIEPPSNIMVNYSLDTDTTPETYEIKGEETKVILYYRYTPKDQVPPNPGLWIDDEALEERGLVHNVAILYGNRAAYTYRPFKKDPDFTTIPPAEEVKLRILSVKSAWNRLTTRYSAGATMCMGKTVVGIQPTSTLGAPNGKHVQYTVQPRRDGYDGPFIPADGEYVELRLAKGDVIDFEVSVPNTHNLFFQMMKCLDCRPTLVDTHFASGRINYHLQYIVEDFDKTLHMCLINLEDKKEFEAERIHYEGLNTEGIEISASRMTIAFDNGHQFYALTKLPPRAWNNVNENHMTWAYNLPYSWAIDRKGFRLSGFVDAFADAISFSKDTEVKTCEDYGDRIFRDIHFVDVGNVNNREPGYSAYAKWELDFNSFYRAHEAMFNHGAFNGLSASVEITPIESKVIQFFPLSENPEVKSNLLPAISIGATGITDIKDAIRAIFKNLMNYPYLNSGDFAIKLAKLPKDTVRVGYHNGVKPLAYSIQVMSKTEQPEPDPEEPIETTPPEESADIQDDGFMIPDEAGSMNGDNKSDEAAAAAAAHYGRIDKDYDGAGEEVSGDSNETNDSEMADEGFGLDGDNDTDTGIGDEPEAVPPVTDEPEPETPEEPKDPEEPEENPEEVPTTPITPVEPDPNYKAQVIFSEDLTENDLSVLDDMPVGNAEFIMFIEPKQEKAFFMNPQEFSFMVQPIYVSLLQKPINVDLIFDATPMKEGESPKAHLIDIQYQGLDPIHQEILNRNDDFASEFLDVDFDSLNHWDPYLFGTLADYYYIDKYLTSRVADITVKYIFRDDIIKTEKWRVPCNYMVRIQADVTPTGKFFKEVTFAMEDAPITILDRDKDGKIHYLPIVKNDTYGIVVDIHSMWDESNPNELTMFFTAMNNTTITIDLMREQLDKDAFCARCAGYVDTSTDEFKTWLEWVPDCKKYTPLH